MKLFIIFEYFRAEINRLIFLWAKMFKCKKHKTAHFRIFGEHSHETSLSFVSIPSFHIFSCQVKASLIFHLSYFYRRNTVTTVHFTAFALYIIINNMDSQHSLLRFVSTLFCLCCFCFNSIYFEKIEKTKKGAIPG